MDETVSHKLSVFRDAEGANSFPLASGAVAIEALGGGTRISIKHRVPGGGLKLKNSDRLA
ncbi:MAG: hypothetical protein ABJM90_10760 [Paracoccaceae bacterium]